MVIKVRCCGYRVSKYRYQGILPIVKLESTFYQYPRDPTVERWRNESLPDFEFTVKANQEISHLYKLKIDPSAEDFDKMKRICRNLEVKVMLI